METTKALSDIAEEIGQLRERFVRSRQGWFLETADQSEFKRLTIEARALLDSALGRMNDFSSNIFQTVTLGSGVSFGGPSYACVEDVAAIMRGAVNHIQRQPLMSGQPAAPTQRPYVDPSRLAAIRSAKVGKWDLSRLAQLCAELNVANEHNCHMSVAMLVRAIVDHVPPIFGCKDFAGVSANYAGGRSFKGSMQQLQGSLRHIADSHLHSHVRQRESVPTAAQVDFRQSLDVLLAEAVRIATA